MGDEGHRVAYFRAIAFKSMAHFGDNCLWSEGKACGNARVFDRIVGLGLIYVFSETGANRAWLNQADLNSAVAQLHA
ncbi:hypothetical protein D3C71_2001560 [compost metagenome]